MDPSSSAGGTDGETDPTKNKHKNTKHQQHDGKRQQFSNKQRMDMYAFCVLELEMHSNKVSIKKQQQAIQKVLLEQKKEKSFGNGISKLSTTTVEHSQLETTQTQNTLTEQTSQQIPVVPSVQHKQQSKINPSNIGDSHIQQEQSPILALGQKPTQDKNLAQESTGTQEIKTLLELQQEVAIMRKCYSDYQKTQVLTSSMLREVQKRFARYYPDAAVPSRTTIKHVFEKCVLHGTVENIKTPRRATKIPEGDEIEYLLIHEPQLSLRQLAQKLNVSTGTVSRRCKALGLIPESVTIKHQQMSSARRQKQIKQFESQSKQPPLVPLSSNPSHQQTHKLSSNCNHELPNTSTQEQISNVIN